MRRNQSVVWCRCETVYEMGKFVTFVLFLLNMNADCNRGDVFIYSCIGCGLVNCAGCNTTLELSARQKKRQKEKNRVLQHVCKKNELPIGAKECPLCHALIIKKGGCDSMRCKLLLVVTRAKRLKQVQCVTQLLTLET